MSHEVAKRWGSKEEQVGGGGVEDWKASWLLPDKNLYLLLQWERTF